MASGMGNANELHIADQDHVHVMKKKYGAGGVQRGAAKMVALKRRRQRVLLQNT